MTKPKKVHLLLGANLGDREATLNRAKLLLEQRAGEISKASHLYETEPWGTVGQPNYLNQALELLTALTPPELLEVTKKIEEALGRTRREKWESRIIDIDILFYTHRQVNTDSLTIPHPQIHRRNFVLIPMLEIAPRKQHPVFKKTIEQLYLESEDELDVIRLEA